MGSKGASVMICFNLVSLIKGSECKWHDTYLNSTLPRGDVHDKLISTCEYTKKLVLLILQCHYSWKKMILKIYFL